MAASVGYEAVPEPIESDEGIATPVHRETMPGPVESDRAMTTPVHPNMVFGLGAQSGARLRQLASRGFASLSGARLTFLGPDAGRLPGAFRSSTLSMAV